MTSKNTREIVRYLEGEELESAYQCWVGHGKDLEPCKRPSTMAVYGLPMCKEHGEEARNGALEEMHQDAYEFFERFDHPHVPELDNPFVRSALSRWELAIPGGLEYSEEQTDELLLAAFPFREDRVLPETAGEIADPLMGQDPPYDSWRGHRYEMHGLMRHAYRLGLTYVVEYLEQEREVCAAQCAYALALDRGEHPEVLERAHRENVEDARKVAEHFAGKEATGV